MKLETISGTTIDHIKPFSFTSIPKNGPNNIPTNNVAIVTAPVLKGLWVVLNIYVIKPSVVAVLPIVEQNRATDTEINAEQIAKLGFSAPTISIPKTGGSNVKIVSGIGKINIKSPNYIGKLKTTDTIVEKIKEINPGVSYPTTDKTQKTNTTTTNTNEKLKNLNSIGSNVKQTEKIVDNASHSNSTASGAISLSELLKFIK